MPKLQGKQKRAHAEKESVVREGTNKKKRGTGFEIN